MWEKCLLAEWIFADSNPGVENMCGLSLLLVLSLASRVFFSGYSSFPFSTKTNISKFQFDQEWYTKNHYVVVLFTYLFRN